MLCPAAGVGIVSNIDAVQCLPAAVQELMKAVEAVELLRRRVQMHDAHVIVHDEKHRWDRIEKAVEKLRVLEQFIVHH